MIKLLVFSCLIASCICATIDVDWGYRNDIENQTYVLPGDWKVKYQGCAGQRQSPIDIEFKDTVYDPRLNELELVKSVGSDKEEWKMVNTGGTVKLTSNKKYQFKNDGEYFNFLQMHFHWRGSEHEVNGHKYAGELHLVHQSVSNPSKLSVIGFFLELSDDDNHDMHPIIDNVKHLKEANSERMTDDLELDKIVPMEIKNYYRYFGSLTTPTCNEIVEWIVVDSPRIKISENQMLEFQAMRDMHQHPILTNSRPVQKANGRIVRRSFMENKLPSIEVDPSMLGSLTGYSDASKLSYRNAIFLSIISCIAKFLFN